MNAQTTHSANTAHISPAGWLQSLVLFGLPGAVLLFNFFVLNPALVRAGVPLVWSFSLSLYGVVYGLLAAALIAYRLEGNPWTWSAFAARMRLQSLSGREWLWVVGAVVLALVGDALLEPAMQWMATTVPLPVPGALPTLFDPFTALVIPPQEYLGVPLAGNLWVAGVYAVSVFGNIIGEELWWRGYILPRQERAFGRWAWLVSGALWVVVFHACMWWAYPTILATGLLTPFVAQRFKSTWAAIAVHGTGNALFIVFILMGVFGG